MNRGPDDLPVRIAAQVAPGFEEALSVFANSRRMDRAEQFALVAGPEAWSDAGAPEADPDRTAVIVGTRSAA